MMEWMALSAWNTQNLEKKEQYVKIKDLTMNITKT